MNRTGYSSTKQTQQEIANKSFDQNLGVAASLPVGFDGTNLQVGMADNLDMKVVEDGTTMYIAVAAPGTAESTALWQVKRIVESGNTTTSTFAGGTADFVHLATDLPGLFA